MGAMQETSWAPHIRESVIADLTPKEVGYVRMDEIQIQKTVDYGPWIPSDEILEYVPNLNEINVEILDDNTDLVGISKKFMVEQDLGLILMGKNISRLAKPSLIILTTYDRYYVIPLNAGERTIKFLESCIQNPGLRLWTTNGLNEADCLYHQFGLKLQNSRASCCIGLHLHLMKVIARTPTALNIYPENAFKLANQPIRMESYTKLLRIWLEISNTSELEYNHDQLIHLTRLPLNQTAINIIKKRCSLVVKLSERLRYLVGLEFLVMNDNVISSLTKLSKGAAKKAIMRMMKKSQKEGEVNLSYFTHLDGCYKRAI